MSFIAPRDGWEPPLPPPHPHPSQQNWNPPTQPVQYVYAAAPQYTSSYLTCKICDRGSLYPKKVFRMSGPAVAVGFILLIPSLLGMIISALYFVGVIAYKGNESSSVASQPAQSFQDTRDANFRRSCAKSARQSYWMSTGSQLPTTMAEEYCECALSVFKVTGSKNASAQTCSQQLNDGVLEVPSQEVQALYSGTAQHEKHASAESYGGRFIGGGLSAASGIACFVGGLLGWFLVMQKRVLQCAVCGAVVNAS